MVQVNHSVLTPKPCCKFYFAVARSSALKQLFSLGAVFFFREINGIGTTFYFRQFVLNWKIWQIERKNKLDSTQFSVIYLCTAPKASYEKEVKCNIIFLLKQVCQRKLMYNTGYLWGISLFHIVLILHLINQPRDF